MVQEVDAVDRVKITGHSTVHLALIGDEQTVCGAVRNAESSGKLEITRGRVTCRRCRRWAELRHVHVPEVWYRVLQRACSRRLHTLASWIDSL